MKDEAENTTDYGMSFASKYIGVKIVQANPCTSREFAKLMGRPFDSENADGYKVRYEDGYVSWCPKVQFEKANRPCNAMTFGHAIEALKKGLRVARQGWNGKGMWILMQNPDKHSKMTLPYLYIEYPEGHTAYPNGSRVPWLASQTDMLADDWMIVE